MFGIHPSALQWLSEGIVCLRSLVTKTKQNILHDNRNNNHLLWMREKWSSYRPWWMHEWFTLPSQWSQDGTDICRLNSLSCCCKDVIATYIFTLIAIKFYSNGINMIDSRNTSSDTNDSLAVIPDVEVILLSLYDNRIFFQLRFQTFGKRCISEKKKSKHLVFAGGLERRITGVYCHFVTVLEHERVLDGIVAVQLSTLQMSPAWIWFKERLSIIGVVQR